MFKLIWVQVNFKAKNSNRSSRFKMILFSISDFLGLFFSLLGKLHVCVKNRALFPFFQRCQIKFSFLNVLLFDVSDCVIHYFKLLWKHATFGNANVRICILEILFSSNHNFYKCCDLTEKVYLMYLCYIYRNGVLKCNFKGLRKSEN